MIGGKCFVRAQFSNIPTSHPCFRNAQEDLPTKVQVQLRISVIKDLSARSCTQVFPWGFVLQDEKSEVWKAVGKSWVGIQEKRKVGIVAVTGTELQQL